ncbi:MAG: riboflavin synthase [Candidatus Nanohaloarchaea archaeon]|nr:riboflavin synthase [Candidatus Nanohaloarchaea archaeon]
MSDLDEKTVGVADTMFARYDMGGLAIETLKENSDVEIERYTVPGFKDLPVAAKKLIEEHDCDIVIALGMGGSADVDKTSAQDASQGLIQVELDTGVHVLKVMVYEDEAKSEEELIGIFEDRVTEHAKNALELLKGKEALTPRAGEGVRQGGTDAGPLGGGGE